MRYDSGLNAYTKQAVFVTLFFNNFQFRLLGPILVRPGWVDHDMGPLGLVRNSAPNSDPRL